MPVADLYYTRRLDSHRHLLLSARPERYSLERDRLSLNRGAFPKRRESDSTCGLLIGGQLGWLEPILWTCGSGWLGL